jgi:hypothetical protein
VIAAVVAIAAIAAAVFLVAPRLRSGGASNEMLLAATDALDEQADLYSVRLGQDEEEMLRLARNVQMGASRIYARRNDRWEPLSGQDVINFGGLVPGSSDLLLTYLDDDQTVVMSGRAGDEELKPIFESDSHSVSGYLPGPSQQVFFTEVQDNGGVRCYLSVAGEEAERVAKGTRCGLSMDGSRLLVIEEDAEKTTVTVSDLDGEGEAILIDDDEGISDVTFAANGSRLAYVDAGEDQEKVILLDASNGDTVMESDEFLSVVDLGFAAAGDAFFFIGEDDEGRLTLYAVREDDAEEVASADAMHAQFNRTGEYLVYLTGDAESQALHVHAMSGGESDEDLFDSEAIQYTLLSDPDRIVALQTEAGDLTVSSASMDGKQTIDLYDENDATLEHAYYLPGEAQIYLIVRLEDGDTLFVSPLAEDTGVALVEDWVSVQLLNRAPDGSRILFAGQEDSSDDVGLYTSLVEAKSEPELLDDDDTAILLNAIVTPDGTQALYSVIVPDDRAEIRTVNLDGSERYKTLYEDYLVLDVGWDVLQPFGFLGSEFQGGEGEALLGWNATQTGRAFCPGAATLQIGDEAEGQLREGVRSCYRIDLEADQIYSITATSRTDTRLFLYDRLGDQLDSDDDSAGNGNPMLRATVPDAGRYYVVVEGYSQNTGSYTISLQEGLHNPAFDNAPQLRPNQTVRGAVTGSDHIQTQDPEISTYGKLYYFEGSRGDRITIDVVADSMGSDLDPKVHLFDPSLSQIASDDDSGADYDSQLTFTLSSSGRYYVLVEGFAQEYGTTSTHWFELTLSVN